MEPIQEAQKDTQPRDADEDPLTEKSHDIQPFENDRDGVKERHCKYETQPRKTDDVQAPVAIQDTEEQPKRKDDVQPLDVNASMEAQDGVQLSKVLQDEEPQVTIQCPDGKQEIQKMEGNRPEMAWDIQPSGIAPENLLDDMREPRKRVATLDDEQEEPSLVEDDIPRNLSGGAGIHHPVPRRHAGNVGNYEKDDGTGGERPAFQKCHAGEVSDRQKTASESS